MNPYLFDPMQRYDAAALRPWPGRAPGAATADPRPAAPLAPRGDGRVWPAFARVRRWSKRVRSLGSRGWRPASDRAAGGTCSPRAACCAAASA